MAHILPDSDPAYRTASPAPRCPHGTTYAQPCYACGWACPTCGRNYAPWVRECNYKHDTQQAEQAPATPILPVQGGSPIAVDIRLPGEWTSPHYQRIVRVSRTWSEILPDLQCYAQNPIPAKDGTVTLCLRLTPRGSLPAGHPTVK